MRNVTLLVLAIFLPLQLLSTQANESISYTDYLAAQLTKEIETVKQFEGFSSTPYKDGDSTSIGYGFYQKYRFKGVQFLPKEQADKYIDSLFRAIHQRVKHTYPTNHTRIAHLMYWLGENGAKKYVYSNGNFDIELMQRNLAAYKKRIKYLTHGNN